MFTFNFLLMVPLLFISTDKSIHFGGVNRNEQKSLNMVEDKRSGHLSTHTETSYAIHADSCHMHEHGAYYDVERSHLQ